LKRLLCSLLVFTAFCLAHPKPSYADSAQIVNVQIKERYARVLVSADLEGVFTKDVEDALMSGMPVTFTFYINLRRSRFMIWDKTEKAVTLHKTVKYDSFTKEFNAIETIADDPPNPESFKKKLEAIRKKNQDTLFSNSRNSNGVGNERYLVLKNRVSLEAWMSHLRDVPIADTLDLKKSKKYYLEIKSEMHSPDLVAPFNYILFFVSFLEFETSWQTSTAFLVKSPGAPITRMVQK